MFEIFDSYRRIIMQGLLTFASLEGWETGPAVIGILLALCSMLVVREVAPYENPSTNMCVVALFCARLLAVPPTLSAVLSPACGARRSSRWACVTQFGESGSIAAARDM